MLPKIHCIPMLHVLIIAISGSMVCADTQTEPLEEIIVTARKRDQSLQDTPLAISVLTSRQLGILGITSLDGLADSIIPSLRINPNGASPGSLHIAIRGDGGFDVGQPTRESSVAIYLDGIYFGRAQGLNRELADLKQVEVLRGPQGTLFGRNSTSGAVSFTTHKPTGEFGIKQFLSAGSYDELRSVTHVNLPTFANVSTKISYMHSQRDGWVRNTLPGQSDFNEYEKEGMGLSLNWSALENLSVEYNYDQSSIDTAQVYFQLYEDTIGVIGRERDRETSTRFPLVLDPVKVDTTGHSLVSQWELTDSLTIKSLTAYRELSEDGFNNYGGTLYFSGVIFNEDTEQEQYSQEFQLIGKHGIVEWVAGLFYFKEDTLFGLQNLISLDPSYNPINPPLAVTSIVPVVSDAKSFAVYGQGDIELNDRTNLSIGLRRTTDRKTASRDSIKSPDIDSKHTDASIALNYEVTENVSTYLRWATAYKAGGYNARSRTFLPFDEEVVKSWELGLKSEWLDRRVRANANAFRNDYKDKQFDFSDPNNPLVIDTLNATKGSKISGLEIDITAQIYSELQFGIHYTYLDGDMPIQPHPDGSGALQQFSFAQTPQHAGAFTVDYKAKPWDFGVLSTHLNITSTDNYAHSSFASSREDAYTLVNGKISLSQIDLMPGSSSGNLSISLWGKNLTDKEYVTIGFPIGTPAYTVIQSFGTPRTAGIDINFEL
jgi:iron complex outermembrane recepter protein